MRKRSSTSNKEKKNKEKTENKIKRKDFEKKNPNHKNDQRNTSKFKLNSPKLVLNNGIFPFHTLHLIFIMNFL